MARILVVDDTPDVRDTVVRALTALGHEASSAVDGGDALLRLKTTAVDLVLTDIVMPVMDGIALALTLANDYPTLPVILMSGYATERQRAYNLSDLISGVLDKPFDLNQLQAVVTQALTRNLN